MGRSQLDEIQADAILDAQLYKIAQLEIKKILDELAERPRRPSGSKGFSSRTSGCGASSGRVGGHRRAVPERRKTRMATDEDVLEFNEEAYIARENTNVVLTRDGWVKRVGRLASAEGTRVREGDEVIAVVPASTLDTVVFFADDGTAYTMRANEVPARGGYGEPIAKFFKMADQVKIVGVKTSDPRFPRGPAGRGQNARQPLRVRGLGRIGRADPARRALPPRRARRPAAGTSASARARRSCWCGSCGARTGRCWPRPTATSSTSVWIR